jgi:hypothetical protein
MIERRSLLLLVFIPVLALIILAGSSFFSKGPRDPILIEGGTGTPTGSAPGASQTPSPGFVSTSTGSYFTVTRTSNCYNGPGLGYQVVLNLQAGAKVEVIGRSQDNSWWRVSEGPSIDCWIASEGGTFSGEAALIPITSSQYATKALTPLPPTKEKRTAEPTNPGGPAAANPTNVVSQPTNTSAPVINTLPPVVITLPPIINTPVPPTSAPPPATSAPTDPPPPEAPQAPPGQIHRPPTHTPKAPADTPIPPPTEPPVATP